MFGAVIGKLLGPVMPYLLAGSIVAIAILSGLLWWSSSKYDTLLSDSASKIERAQANANQFEQITKDQQSTINNMIIKQAEDRIRSQFRNRQLALSQKTLDEERRKHENYMSRWSKVASKKPGLLANIINRATAKRVRRFTVATCRAGCGTDRDQRSGNNPATEAGSGSNN